MKLETFRLTRKCAFQAHFRQVFVIVYSLFFFFCLFSTSRTIYAMPVLELTLIPISCSRFGFYTQFVLIVIIKFYLISI